MQVEVNIKPEDIDQAVVNAVLQSQLGVKVQEAIAKTLDDLTKSAYNQNSVSGAVREAVTQIIREAVQNRFRAQIEARVNEILTEKVVADLVDAAWKTFLYYVDRTPR